MLIKKCKTVKDCNSLIIFCNTEKYPELYNQYIQMCSKINNANQQEIFSNNQIKQIHNNIINNYKITEYIIGGCTDTNILNTIIKFCDINSNESIYNKYIYTYTNIKNRKNNKLVNVTRDYRIDNLLEGII